jgi:hypothetical protein
MWHVRGRGEVHIGDWWGNMKERYQLENFIVRWRRTVLHGVCLFLRSFTFVECN